ncbi:MAG: hypothetical protein ACYS30_22455, partial [Planctomycetota bacterium]
TSSVSEARNREEAGSVITWTPQKPVCHTGGRASLIDCSNPRPTIYPSCTVLKTAKTGESLPSA